MFVSMNWIKEYVDIKKGEEEALIKKFTLATAEVEEIIYKGRDTENVVVGVITSIKDMPIPSKNHLLTVDIGEKKPAQVVCGAANARVGLRVAFAKAPAKVCGKQIEKTEISGAVSEGMCCSAAELGIGADNGGILEIKDVVAPGIDFKEAFCAEDIVFEVDNKSLTNRPDLWGHYGIAREIALLAGKKLKPLYGVNLADYDGLPPCKTGEFAEGVQRYTGIKIENVTRRFAPLYIQIRLFYAGMRSINFLADLTNYVMLDVGQPMHAFDARLMGTLGIRTFDKPFDFTLLDGQTYRIEKDTLMITSDGKPMCVAGVMGGQNSEIVGDSSGVFLESATFDAVSIRRAAQKLKLRTDASARYEKSLDPENCAKATAFFIGLLSDFDKGARVTSRFTDVYKYRYPALSIDFDIAYLSRMAGFTLPEPFVKKTLTALGFALSKNGKIYTARVPSWRATKDVSMKQDLVEEVCRVYGYDNFVPVTTKSPLSPVRRYREKSVEAQIKDVLVSRFGFFEVNTYLWGTGNLQILNPVNPDIKFVRDNLLQSLIALVPQNKGFAEEFGIFEIGHAATPADEKRFAFLLYSKRESEELLLVKAKKILLSIGRALLNRDFALTVGAAASPIGHPKLNYAVENLGCLSALAPAITEKLDRRAAIVVCELDFAALAALPETTQRVTAVSKFPAVDIDLSLIIPKTITYAQAAKHFTAPHLTGVALQSLYGDTTTLRFTFVAQDKTLLKDEVMQSIAQIIQSLAPLGITVKSE